MSTLRVLPLRGIAESRKKPEGLAYYSKTANTTSL
jgi:hypothetical protein